MIRINQIKIDIDKKNIAFELENEIKRLLKIKEFISYEIVKKSIDARKKPKLYYVYAVDVKLENEAKVLKKASCKQALLVKEQGYVWPKGNIGNKRPVVVGMGPAGLFCGYMLAKAGLKPIIFERGSDVDKRSLDVETFWKDGKLKPESNVLFGEGGAGTFSDGKLNTLVNDKSGRNREVLRIFVENGAPKHILYDAKPHVGTDILKVVVKNMRNKIIDYGGQIYFEHKLTDIIKNDSGLTAVFNDDYRVDTRYLVLAIGHSARDTFKMLYSKEVPMEAKAFAVGFRVQHPQELINLSMYGEENLNKGLPEASYKLTYHTDNDRGVYSFCMCPGGYVVNASSEEGRLAINGMSYSGRDSKVANSAIIISVTPEDFNGSGPLCGLDYQRDIEKKAYDLAGGAIPYETLKEFKEKELKEDSGDYSFKFKGSYKKAAVHEILTDELNNAFVEGMDYFARLIDGFNNDNTLVAGIESRTSSPVRIHRDERHESDFKGIYPCGEGAGYAGGIMSAAMDGMLIAEEIWKR